MENGLCAWRLPSFSTFTVALTKNVNYAFKPYLAHVFKPIQWHHYHCGGGSFRGLFQETWAGWPPCAPGRLGSRGYDSRAVCHVPTWKPRLSQKLPVPALPAQQHWTAALAACAHAPAPKAGISRSQGSWLRHLIPDKISSSVLTLYKDFPFSATSGGKKVACKIPQKVSFRKQALGSALEDVAHFGVSLPPGSWAARRSSAVCMHSAAPTEILQRLGKRLEDTWSTSRAIQPGILSWAALWKFAFHIKSDIIQFWSPLLWYWWLITLCWAAFWHSKPLRFWRINK